MCVRHCAWSMAHIAKRKWTFYGQWKLNGMSLSWGTRCACGKSEFSYHFSAYLLLKCAFHLHIPHNALKAIIKCSFAKWNANNSLLKIQIHNDNFNWSIVNNSLIHCDFRRVNREYLLITEIHLYNCRIFHSSELKSQLKTIYRAKRISQIKFIALMQPMPFERCHQWVLQTFRT